MQDADGVGDKSGDTSSQLTLLSGQTLMISTNRLGAPPEVRAIEIIGELGHGSRVNGANGGTPRGRSYKARFVEEHPGGDNGLVFVKLPRVDLADSYAEFSLKLQNIGAMFDRELSKRADLDQVPCIAHVIDKNSVTVSEQTGGALGSDVDVAVPFLVQEYIEGTPLPVWLEQHYAENGEFSGIRSEDDWFEIATQLTDVVRRVHNRGVIHGDIWPENILMCRRGTNVRSTSQSAGAQAGENVRREPDPIIDSASETARGYLPYLVDFGESVLIREESYKRSSADIEGAPYMAHEKRKSGHVWSFPADVYSLGAVLFYLATGQDPSALEMQKDELKSYIADTMVKKNRTLHERNPGVAHIIDKSLRNSPHDRFYYADDVRRFLRVFGPNRDIDLKERLTDLDSEVRRFLDKEEASNSSHQIFAGMIASELERLRRQTEEIQRGHLEVVGDRELLIDYLLNYLSVLREGDEYITITSPMYWTDHNLGSNGRFLTMNRIKAREGVTIKRVFILSKHEATDVNVLAALEDHARYLGLRSSEPNTAEANIYTGVHVLTESDPSQLINDGEPVALWRRPGSQDGTADEMVSIAFSMRPRQEQWIEPSQSSRAAGHEIGGRAGDQRGTYSGVDSLALSDQIGKIRFWASSRQRTTLARFERLVEKSVSLVKFLDQPNADG